MSSENLQQQQPPILNLNQNDCHRILDKLFQGEQSPQSIDTAFKHFEANFRSQPALINSIIDYYFDQSNKSSGLTESANANVQICLSQNNKTIIDLIFLVPDDFVTKIYDRIGEKLNNSPSSSNSNAASLNVTISAQHIWLKTLERALTLLCLVVQNKKAWVPKLLSHSLFSSLVKLLKVNSNLNDQVIVESCILFVALINFSPLQIMNTHLDSVLQTFIHLFKHYTYLEQNKVFADGITWRSVKWSIRLFFYVCYGLFPTQFIQNFRKKDYNLINKEFIRTTAFYLRFHPALMREKIESSSEKQQFKQSAPNCDDYSLEWRQYCLDPACTNYNQVIFDMIKSGGSTATSNLLKTSSSSIYTLLNRPPSASHSHRTAASSVLSPLILSAATSDSAYVSFPPPISPAGLFAVSSTHRLQELAESGNQTVGALSSLSSARKSINNSSFTTATTKSQASMPTTPNLFNQSMNNNNANNQSLVFQYPPVTTTTNQQQQQQQQKIKSQQPPQLLNNNSIKNLTLQFMVNETEMIGDWMMTNDDRFAASSTAAAFKKAADSSAAKLRRSHSDSNLANANATLDDIRAKVRRGMALGENRSSVTTANFTLGAAHKEDESTDELVASVANKLVKSEMRDRNIREPEHIDHSMFRAESFHHAADSSAIANENLKQSQITTSATDSSSSSSTSPNQTIARLKQDLNHLAIQLVYERHLRNKYEEDSNRLHFIKIQCDQLREEKSYLEKNLKEMVEMYKNEVEECLNEQKRVELDAYRNEIREKDLLIENLQQRLNSNEKTVNDLTVKFDEIKAENQRLESENGKLMQLLEREQNLKTKNEIDQSYLKSLRYTTDLLRKKLLIMSKSQQELYQGFSNELTELSQIYNSPLFSSLTQNKEQLFQIDTTNNNNSNSNNIDQPSTIASSLLLTPLYQFQQTTIEVQQRELEQLRQTNRMLMAKFDENQIELETCRNNLILKDKKIDELIESLDCEVLGLLKNHHRIQASLTNVNKRLEEEIVKLKANLNEQTVESSRLKERLKYQEENSYRILKDCEGNLVGPNNFDNNYSNDSTR